MQLESQHSAQFPDDETLFQRLLSKYLPYWPLFVLALLAGGMLAWVFIKIAIPQYEATAKLIIKDEKKGNEESKLMESFNLISSKKIIENEIEVIQSRKLMKEVAADLDLFTPISQKEWLVKQKSAWFSSPVRVIAPQPDSLLPPEKRSYIPLHYNEKEHQVLLDGTYAYPLGTRVNTPFGPLEFVSNDHYKPDTTAKGPFYLSIIKPVSLIPGLLEKLKVEPAGKLSSVVNLSYRDEFPDRAEQILNGLIQAYRQSETDEKNFLAKNALDFVNARLEIITKDLDTIQNQVEAYKTGSNTVDISTQGKLYLQNVSDNDQKLRDINAQISVLNQVESFVKTGTGGEGIALSVMGIEDKVLTELLNQLNKLDLEYEKGKATIGENNPRLLEIKDQIEKIKPIILKNINSQQKSLLTVKSNINSANTAYNTILREVPQKERMLIDLTREEQNKRGIYEFLLQKKEESEIAYASTVAGTNRVVDFAEAGIEPVSPNKKLVIAGAIAFLMFVVMGFITARESFTGKIMYRQEIESRTKIPVIGEIAYNKTKESIVIRPGIRTVMAEEFRRLRLSLSYAGINENHKKILVTSGISGEGKSFIAANLAVSLTLIGKKVVLVDMDLNNPSQEKIFGREESDGVTEFLKKEEDTVTIREIPEYENLYLVAAGNLPENPGDLLMNGKAEEMINCLSKNFDVVVIDTSPLNPVTDGYLLTQLCDATLYVVRHQYTPKIIIKRLDNNNLINPIHNPAIVFNGVKPRGFLSGNYGYGYGYTNPYKYKERRKKTISLKA